MSTIKFNELAAKTALTTSDLLAIADINGIVYKGDLEQLNNFVGVVAEIGYKGAISPTDPAPTEDGFYLCQSTGVYTNFGATSVDLGNGITFISVEDTQTVFKQSVISAVKVETGIVKNSVKLATSGDVYSETSKFSDFSRQLIQDYNPDLNYIADVTVLATDPTSPSQDDTYYVYEATNNTIFTGVVASSGDLIIYNNSAWEVHKVIPVQNKNLFKNPNKIGFGTFTYVSTTQDFENYIANSITYINAKKLPDNILLKIGWFRNDTTSFRFRLFKSDDNGVSWVTYPNQDINLESDGYTLKVENYTEYLLNITFDLREIQSLGSFNYYIVPNIETEGNLIFNNNVLKVAESSFKGEFTITSDEDITALGGTITGGSDFKNNPTEIPIYLTPKGTIKVKARLTEDIFSADKSQIVFQWLAENESLSVMTLRNLPPRANELWNQRMDSYFYFVDGQSTENFIIRPGGGLVENSSAYTVNGGTLFAVRYVGSTPITDIDLRVTKNATTLFFHDGNAGIETNTRASFTLSSYATVEALINAIEANTWCAANIEILFKNGLSETVDKLGYVNATKMVSKEVRQVDYTTRPTIQPTPPADPTGYTEWDWVYDAFPVYIEKNAIDRIVEITVSWNQNTMECYLDGKRMRKENPNYTPYSAGFNSTLYLNNSGSPFAGEILGVEYTQEFTRPEGLIIPIEAHVLQHDYDETTASAASLTMSLQRLTDIGILFKNKGWKCITANELKRYKQEGKNPPYKSWLMVTDDYRKDWFTTKDSRNLMDNLNINVSFNVIGSDADFTTDRALWQTIHNSYGWDVHTHCKWHTETSYLSYNDFVSWCNDAKTVFDDNYLSNTIITIPFSIQFIRVVKGFEHLGFNLIFTGAVDEYEDLNDVPHYQNNAPIRLLADSNISLDNLKNTLDLFDVYD